ncbi:18923_t:CDS:10, partial [Entrophospora sp. SA101]
NGGFNKLTSTVAGLVKPGKYEDSGFDPKEWLDPGDERKMALFTQYAICAAKQALFDAEWISISDDDKEKTGVCIGSGIGSFQDIIDTSMIYKEHACKSSFYDYGAHKVNPMFIPRVLINMAAGHLSLKYGFHGPNHSVSTACTTGAHSIGDASRFIQFGDADVMIAATKFNDNPKEASRPFDKDRNGFVISEGAGMLVLEEYHHAISRGARIYAEICGYGLSGDAYHMTAPHENGHGAKLAMIRSLNHSKILPKDIDYINTHATSTLIGDVAEIKAIHSLFHSKDNNNKKNLAISSTKGSIGHLLGAAGAVEAIFTILAIYHDILPPNLNLNSLDSQLEKTSQFNFVQTPIDQKVNYALTNSFGFGGTNASLCFKKFGIIITPTILYYYFYNNSSKDFLSSTQFIYCKITSIKQINHNTTLYRLRLPNPLNQPLPISSCIQIKDEAAQILREYTPINNTDDDKSYLELLIKKYKNGYMSNYLNSLKVGDSVSIRGPLTTWKYETNMKKYIGMICGGTGITPMKQIISHILQNPDDKTKLFLLYSSLSKSDVLLYDELNELANKYPDRLKIYYTIDNPPSPGNSNDDWKWGVGFINEDMIKKFLPNPNEDIMILVCGPDGLIRHISGDKGKNFSQGAIGGLLKRLGYNKSQVFKF